MLKTLKGSWQKSTAPMKIKRALSGSRPLPLPPAVAPGGPQGRPAANFGPGPPSVTARAWLREHARARGGAARPSPAPPTAPNGREAGGARPSPPHPSPPFRLSFSSSADGHPPSRAAEPPLPHRPPGKARPQRGGGGVLGGSPYLSAAAAAGTGTHCRAEGQREGAPPPYPPQPAPPLSGLSPGRGRLRAAEPPGPAPLLRPRPRPRPGPGAAPAGPPRRR